MFDTWGDIPFVHWANYEMTKLNLYIARYGDAERIAERVKANLLDLLTVAKNSIVIPVPSFSLKVIEKYIGFKRSQSEFGGQWAMANSSRRRRPATSQSESNSWAKFSNTTKKTFQLRGHCLSG